MADTEDIQPLVCDNGTGMVKVSVISCSPLMYLFLIFFIVFINTCQHVKHTLFV